MLLRLSSRGRLVIPKELRESLQLRNDDQIRVQVINGNIILEPLPKDIVRRLYGKYAVHNLLNALEKGHRREIKNE